MKKKQTPAKTSTRSWRQIRQTASRKVVTAHARRKVFRGMLRSAVAIATVAAASAATYFGVGYWQQGVQKVNTVLPAQPLREIVFTTDGVLSKEWVEATLALPYVPDIMAIDIHRKKQRIEEHGQVKSAVIRRLPDRLTIDIQERRPVVRLRTRDESGQVVNMLVDRDGYVYRGTGYDSYELSTLPLLGGVTLQRAPGGGFRRLAGIDQVDDLLRTARSEFPRLYSGWEVVDRGEAPLLKVRSEDIHEIVFAPGRYTEQLRWLDMIVENNRRQMLGMKDRVDLSLGNQVVVR